MSICRGFLCFFFDLSSSFFIISFKREKIKFFCSLLIFEKKIHTKSSQNPFLIVLTKKVQAKSLKKKYKLFAFFKKIFYADSFEAVFTYKIRRNDVGIMMNKAVAVNPKILTSIKKSFSNFEKVFFKAEIRF
jgi:hypothetical protein